MSDVAEDTGLSTSAEQEELLQRALLQFDEIANATREERMMALEDRRFLHIHGAQWEGDWGAAFENTIRVQIPKVKRGHRKIINDYRANRFAVNFRPIGNQSDDDTAELLNGLMFADMYRSRGQQALDNAFSDGAAGGFGAWRLCNEYEDESDPDNDHQRIRIEQIADADQRVFFDLDSKLYDKSDARFAYVMNAMSPRAFKREYGEDRLASWPENRARPNWFDWFRPQIVYVAEYYEVEHVKRELRIFTREQTGEEERYWAEDDDGNEITNDLIKRGFTMTRRKINRRRVHKWLMSGAEVLEDCGYIAGENIPVIPFYGSRVFIDNVERFQGHVRDAKDAQRVYNAQISKLAETASLAPREVPIFAASQVEGLQTNWANMNLERHAYAVVHPLMDGEGNIVAAGPVGKVEAPQVPPVLAALIQQTGADIDEITNGEDASMEIKSNVSGEAMDIAASRVDQRSFLYMDNFRQSMQRFGEVYYGMAKEVYVEEGREVEVMDEEGETQTATLHEVSTNGNGVTAKRYDLSQGKFKVIADVTEATATRRDKTVRTMMTLAQAAVAVQALPLGQACLLTAIDNMDGEAIQQLQDFTHKMAVSIGLEEPTPEEQQAAQGEQQPDPTQLAALAQAKALDAQAENFQSQAVKNKAQTILALAQAKKANAESQNAPDFATDPKVNDFFQRVA